MATQRLPPAEPGTPPARPVLPDHLPPFVLLEREVELEYRPQMLAALQKKVDAVEEAARASVLSCPHCGRFRCEVLGGAVQTAAKLSIVESG